MMRCGFDFEKAKNCGAGKLWHGCCGANSGSVLGRRTLHARSGFRMDVLEASGSLRAAIEHFLSSAAA